MFRETFRWLFGKSKEAFPSYWLLEATPSRGLPQDLVDREASAEHEQARDQIEAGLFAQPTDESAPGFATFLKSGEGLLNLRLPQLDGGCLLVFSSPLRAADYARVQAPEENFQYFCSSPTQVVPVLQEFRERAGARRIVLDRCPRCDTFTATGVESLDSATKVANLWKIFKATEIARQGLYWGYARAAARDGQFLTARDVALETVGHVTCEDPRSHLLLGKLAIQLRDKRLLRDAKVFLVLLKQQAALEELQQAERSGVVWF